MTARRGHLAGLIVLWLLTALYLSLFAYRGWVPHDEGLLAQSAERVLGGELPHRDFADAYTGGLSYFHALAFRLLGVKLTALRTALLLTTLAWVPVLHAIAARFAPPVVVAFAVALAVVWSVPNYSAGLPSWYVLFCATFGTYALLRHLDTERVGWLLVAGAWGGVAFLVKSIGLLFVAAGALFVLYLGHLRAPRSRERSRALLGLETAALVGLVAVVCAVVAARLGASEIFHFVVPVSAVATAAGWSEWRAGAGTLRTRVRWLAPRLGVFGLGFALPVVLFLVPYAAHGALGDLWRDVFVLPQRRVAVAFWALPPLWTAAAVIPYAAVLMLSGVLAPQAERRVFRSMIVAAIVLLLLAATPPVYRLVWYSVRALLPVVCVVGCAAVVREDLPPSRRAEVFLLVAVVALMSLVQYPYAYAIYFCYVAPLLVLATLALVASQRAAPRSLHLCALWFYLAFGMACVNTGTVGAIGVTPGWGVPKQVLQLPRAGLLVARREEEVYARVIGLVQQHTPPGAAIYAAPDSPEIYFLAERRNPTRTMYDFLDDDFGDDGAGRERRIADTLAASGVNVVVINGHPEFSPRLAPDLAAVLARRYPHAERVRWFTVRWRT